MSFIYNFFGDGVLVSDKCVRDGKQIAAIYQYTCNFCSKNNIKDSKGLKKNRKAKIKSFVFEINHSRK
jgi:hypothetical protein